MMDLDPQMPFISVIVAVRNGAKTIQRCIHSFSRQTYPLKELVVMDGASTDGTVALLSENAAAITYWESQKDIGLCHAWNKALAHAKGEWICFLGADDFFWDDLVLERVAEKVSAVYPRHRVAYGRIYSVKENGEILERVGVPWKKARKSFYQVMALPHQGVFHHRTLFEDHGGFDETFRVAGDYEFLLRELKDNDAWFFDDLVIAGMQRGGLTGRGEQGLFLLREIERARKKNGLSGLKLTWWFHFARSWSRSVLRRAFGKRASDAMADCYRVCVGKRRIWTR
jgi:glycosyltransferase involved in cell wall biosynthesis